MSCETVSLTFVLMEVMEFSRGTHLSLLTLDCVLSTPLLSGILLEITLFWPTSVRKFCHRKTITYGMCQSITPYPVTNTFGAYSMSVMFSDRISMYK